MAKKNTKTKLGRGVGDRLDLESYHKICGGLWQWRIEDFIRGIDKGKTSILAFVRGLHFSAQIIYEIRELISKKQDLEADWGHLLDRDGKRCSRECDIIIHKGHHRRWNGNEKPIMNFKFIKQENVVLVISCKSLLKSGHIDKNYVKVLEPFTKNVWLVAECCEDKQLKKIESQARQAGYKNFLCMYTLSSQTSSYKHNENGWLGFAKKIRKMKA